MLRSVAKETTEQMSSNTAEPKLEGVTNKPKVAVATVMPNIHRKTPLDQEADEQDEIDGAIFKKRKVFGATRRPSLMKVKEIDDEDDHHSITDGNQKDRSKRTTEEKVTEDADEEKPKRPAGSKQTEDDQKDPRKRKTEAKQTEDADEEKPKRPAGSKQTEDDQKDPRKRNTEAKQTEDADEEHPKRPAKPKQTEGDDQKDRRRKSEAKPNADKEDAKRPAESKRTEDAREEIVPSDAHGEIALRVRKKSPAHSSERESEESHHHRGHRGGWSIRKDDEFFHFIIVCFAFGAVLVCYHNYADWTISTGIGLLIFASLETIGIYFGFVDRIRAVLEGFLPLLRRSAISGISKQD